MGITLLHLFVSGVLFNVRMMNCSWIGVPLLSWEASLISSVSCSQKGFVVVVFKIGNEVGVVYPTSFRMVYIGLNSNADLPMLQTTFISVCKLILHFALHGSL